MPLYRTEGICLRSYELKEADRIVVLLTRDQGKVRAVAKGVRRPGSRLAGSLLPFTHSRLLLHRGRELDKVVQCEAVFGFRALREELERMAAASYLAELADGFLGEKDPNAGLFPSFLASLHLLAGHPDLRHALVLVQGLLLASLGYRPELDICVHCGADLEEGREAVVYHPGEGGVLCGRCGSERKGRGTMTISRGAWQTLRRLWATDPGRLTMLRPGKAVRGEMETLLRATMIHRLERRPKTLDFLDLVLRESE